MKKTNTFMRIIAVTLVALAIGAAQARGAVTVYADEMTSNNPVVTATSSSETNAPVSPADGGERKWSVSGKPPVRIDETGVHVGGPNPVDINVPTSWHSREHGIDVVGIVAVVFGCAVPIAIVAIVFYSRHRRLKMHHETMRAMIDKGMPIPPEMAAGTRGDLLMGNTDVRPGRNDFRGGLILVAIGSALLMIVGKVGWILVFIGAARLVFWLVEDRNPKV